MGTWTTSPRTAVVGGKITAANYNAYERDFASAFGAMSSYTPTWTAATTDPVIGNGTLSGWYTQVQKMVWFRIRLTMGSTTTYGSGRWYFSTPAAAVSLFSGASESPGNALLYDSSLAARYVRTAYFNGTTTMGLIADDGTGVSSTAPFTWATGDTLSIAGWFEAA